MLFAILSYALFSLSNGFKLYPSMLLTFSHVYRGEQIDAANYFPVHTLKHSLPPSLSLNSVVTGSDIMPKTVIAIYKEKTPIKLFRILTGKKQIVQLRELNSQLKKGARSFDVIVKDDGLVHPISGMTFSGPNGMSLRPEGLTQYEILESMKGNVSVVEIPESEPIPKGLVLVHEHNDHYSMQSDCKCSLKELNLKLNAFLCKYEKYSKATWFEKYRLQF